MTLLSTTGLRMALRRIAEESPDPLARQIAVQALPAEKPPLKQVKCKSCQRMFPKSRGRTVNYCSAECQEIVRIASDYRKLQAYNMKAAGANLQEIGEALNVRQQRAETLVWQGKCIIKFEEGLRYCYSCGGRGTERKKDAVNSTCLHCDGEGWVKI